MLPRKLIKKLEERQANYALRQLGVQNTLVDFSSNDYLGFSKDETIFKTSHNYLSNNNSIKNGATGSRLLSGNHTLYNDLETKISQFHNSEAALVFNSGYTANLGFFSCVPQRNDIIFYDEFIHASIRDGIIMSNAKAYKFKHNDLEDLSEKCHTERSRSAHDTQIYIVTESVFSMDGDTPNLKAFAGYCKQNNCHLIVDEAHAIGVFGKNGVGLIQDLSLEQQVFTRIITCGKALGCHGAAILCSAQLKQYLINFSRPFIYTTGLPPHGLATINSAYKVLETTLEINKLHKNISFFKTEIKSLKLDQCFIDSNSAIHCCIIPGNKQVKALSKTLEDNGFNVKPILSPTVPKGQERLRFCIHAYNTEAQITKVLQLLAIFVLNK